MVAHKTFDALEEILGFILETHTSLHSTTGVYYLKMLRKPDGSRVPFEETKGMRIKDFTIYNENTVIIEQHSHGTTFKNHRIHTLDVVTYLPNLEMINVYDHSAEFCSASAIDFVYLEQTKSVKTVMLAAWIHDVPRVLRAQWFRDEAMQKTLEEVGVGRKLRRFIPKRNIEVGEDSL